MVERHRRTGAREAHRGHPGALRDKTNRDGFRVVIELRRDAVAGVVLNQLYRLASLQSSFGANMVALEGGRPQIMNLEGPTWSSFIAFREQVIYRRIKHLLEQGARPRPHPGRFSRSRWPISTR